MPKLPEHQTENRKNKKVVLRQGQKPEGPHILYWSYIPMLQGKQCTEQQTRQMSTTKEIS